MMWGGSKVGKMGTHKGDGYGMGQSYVWSTNNYNYSSTIDQIRDKWGSMYCSKWAFLWFSDSSCKGLECWLLGFQDNQ